MPRLLPVLPTSGQPVIRTVHRHHYPDDSEVIPVHRAATVVQVMMPLLTPTAPHLATSTDNHSHTPGQVTAVSSRSVGNSQQVSYSVAQ